MDILSEYYSWIKALHIIFVIFWCAGLLMLPRYFVYHSQTPVGSEEDTRWQERETRLLRIIMNPALIFTWVFGLSLSATASIMAMPWFSVKFAVVVLLTVFHMMLSKWRRNFAAGLRPRGEVFYRRVNELPSLAIIIIVIMVVVRPF